MEERSKLSEKIREIRQELRQLGVWRNVLPDWVAEYRPAPGGEHDFVDWLQFVYLPNCALQPARSGRQLIVPQALKFFSGELQKGRLLQLLIELDALD